ncbi:hypothetical protein AAFN85_16220 [Mucilaginibacter sp. CAU 1740]|uniref:hypothetical protein n=1 Tax=Mucilaginibacter sp. CAU 1740 TaxID=3140365 RepID=UPI00325C15C6
MAQLLVIEDKKRRLYQPIASIRDYSEPDFEAKLFKYSKELFSNYYAVKFKYTIKKKSDISESYEPDLLLISKKFNRWILVEVELCKPDLGHTFRQIDTFLDPYFDPDDVIKFLLKHNETFVQHKAELINLIKTNAKAPEVLVIFDDYDKKVFEKIDLRYKSLNVCVLEVYREHGNHFDAYRLGGKYPYDITNTTKIAYYDEMHFTIEKADLVSHLSSGEIEVHFNMVPYNAVLTKPKKKNSKCMLKIVDHNFDKNDLLQLVIDVDNKLIIQPL